MTSAFEASLNEFTALMDQKIAEYFQKRKNLPEEVRTNLRNYILQGGKRIRPYILYRMNEEYRNIPSLDDILMGFEFLHNSTLIDDDIIDEHAIRRNKPTLPAVYKNKNYQGEYAALLQANILRNLGMELLLKAEVPADFREECLSAYLDIGRSIDEAQMEELAMRGSPLVGTKRLYLRTLEKVAARFLAYMFQLGVGDSSPYGAIAKRTFFQIGNHLGLAFQLADDLMDINPTNKKGRSIGDDIRVGTPTSLSDYAAKQLLGTADGERLVQLYRPSPSPKSPEDLSWIIRQYEKTGAVNYVKNQIKNYLGLVNENLTEMNIPPEHWLHSLVDFFLRRDH